MSNVLIIPEKNEKLKPLNAVERGLMSDNIDEVYIVDGWSNDESETLLKANIPKLAKKYKKRVTLFRSELRNTGKGGAMYTGIKKALEAGHSKIVFLDADITSTTPEWCDWLVRDIDKYRVDMVKGTFDRAPFDAQITRHITRPLISMFFPEGRKITQPLGGELSMTSELAKHLVTGKIAPTHTWGIDTFFIINALTGGYRIGERYLGQKVHNKKSTIALRPMVIECFDEAAKQIYYHERHVSVPSIGKPLVKIIKERTKGRTRIGTDVRKLKYTDPEIEIKAFLNHTATLKANGIITSTRINNVPISKFSDRLLFLDLMFTKTARKFKEKSRMLGKPEWIRILDLLVRKYIHFGFATRYYELIYLLWRLRALCFMLNEAKDFEDAERNTQEQANLAFEFAQNNRSAI